MSIKTIVSCDRCGAEIQEDRTALDVRCGPLLKTVHICFDLCPDCIPAFLSWFVSYSPNSYAETRQSCG